MTNLFTMPGMTTGRPHTGPPPQPGPAPGLPEALTLMLLRMLAAEAIKAEIRTGPSGPDWTWPDQHQPLGAYWLTERIIRKD